MSVSPRPSGLSASLRSSPRRATRAGRRGRDRTRRGGRLSTRRHDRATDEDVGSSRRTPGATPARTGPTDAAREQPLAGPRAPPLAIVGLEPGPRPAVVEERHGTTPPSVCPSRNGRTNRGARRAGARRRWTRGRTPGRAGDDVERAGRGDGEDDGGDEGHARDGVADDVFEPGEARDQPAREDGLDDEVPPRRRHATRADVGGGRGRGGESAPVLARTNAPTSAPGRVPASTPARSRSGPGRRRPASTRASPASRVLRARLVPARDGVDEAERVQWRRHEAGGVVRAAAASVAWGRT